MARTTIEIQSALLGYLKAQTVLTVLLVSGTAIKETHFQGEQFDFPAIRLSTDLYPSVNGCGPDKADFVIETFSAQKSSLECEKISGVLYNILHKRAFASMGTDYLGVQHSLHFSVVDVTKVTRPEISIYGWKSSLFLTTEVN